MLHFDSQVPNPSVFHSLPPSTTQTQLKLLEAAGKQLLLIRKLKILTFLFTSSQSKCVVSSTCVSLICIISLRGNRHVDVASQFIVQSLCFLRFSDASNFTFDLVFDIDEVLFCCFLLSLSFNFVFISCVVLQSSQCPPSAGFVVFFFPVCVCVC
ncbi:hypothetical protein INR49_028762, partial [Caranx melampygus]